MGFKLQDQIQQMRGIPGKYKRILLAISQRARNDGTNFYESQQTIADKAGVSRYTAYRNIEGLVQRSILVSAESHDCSNDACPKGSQHHAPGVGKRWTQAYNVDLTALKNASWRKNNDAKCDVITALNNVAKCNMNNVAKCNMNNVAKCNMNNVAKCDTILVCDYSGSANAPDSSVLADGSELVSEQDYASRPESSSEKNQEQPPCAVSNQTHKPQEQEPEPEQEEINAHILLSLITPKPHPAAIPNGIVECQQILEHFAGYAADPLWAADMVLRYNRAHRSGKYASKQDKLLYIRTPAQFLKALESQNGTMLNDYLTHEISQCERCKQVGVMDYRTPR